MARLLRNRLYARNWDLGTPTVAMRADGLRIPNASTVLHSARRCLSRITPLPSYQRNPAISKDISQSIQVNHMFLPFRSGILAASASSFSTPVASRLGLEFSGYNCLGRRRISPVLNEIWQRQLHTSGRRRNRAGARRHKSSITSNQNGKGASTAPKDAQTSAKPSPDMKEKLPVEQSSGYMHLPHMPHMPKIPHRPTKEELLAAANGFFSRLKVRFKWLTIRSTRPWNVDDWSAFVSWFVMGNLIWIFVGTTTFFSLVIYTINTVVAQGKNVQCMTFDGLLIINSRNSRPMGR